MSKASIHFKKLTVDRMYGLPMGLSLENLAPGVNVVYGPNAAGKSSLARAIAALLWPEQDERARAFARAVVQIENAEWGLDLEGGRCLYQRDGVASDRPALPTGDHRDRYQLSLPELLQADNKRFARAVMQEAVGGLDVEAAARALGFTRPAPASGKETRRAVDAFGALSDEREKQVALDGERRHLAEYRREYEEARHAVHWAAFLELALDFVRARDRRLELENALRRFPAVLVRLTGGEPGDVGTWRLKRQDLLREKADAARQLEVLQKKLAESALFENGLPEGTTMRLEERLNEIRRVSDLVRRLEQELVDAGKREEVSWQHIRGALDSARAARVDVAAIGELGRFGIQAERLRSRRAAQKALEALLREEAEHPAPEVLSNAALQLQRWLAASRRERTSSLPLKAALIASALAVAAVAVYAGINWSPAGYGLILIDILLGYVWHEIVASGKGDSSETYRRDFTGTAVREPRSWDVDGVEARLSGLYQELAEAHVAHLKRRKLRDAQGLEEELSREESALEEARQRLLAELGVDPGHGDEELSYLVERIAQWQAAYVDVERSSAGLEAARAGLADELSELHAETRRFGFECPADAASAAQIVAALNRAASEFADLQRAIETAEGRLRRADADIQEVEARLEDVFHRAGLERDDDAGLHHLCGMLEGYGKMRSELDGAAAVEMDRAAKAESHELCEEAVMLSGAAEVERLLEEARQKSALVDQLKERLGRIEYQIEQAERSHALEKARAEHEEALQDLDAERLTHFRSLAGWLVADFVRERTRDQQLPPVFKRARALFAEITANRYELRFDGEAFLAYDNVRERGLSIDELSSGTRVQLLLSVRVAFLEEQEQGLKLPLVLDETLANSDDGKAKAIIDAILGIAGRDRQVFYFTCQEDEVAKWKRIADGQTSISCAFFPLMGASRPEDIDERALPSPALFRKVPEPKGLTHDRYGRELGVDPWDAHAEPGSLHLWYLVEDCELLHRLLESGFERWGQLRALSGSPNAILSGPDSRVHARIRALARAVEAWRDAWKVGRGRRVDREVLEDSGAVTSAFLDKVAELCDGVRGNGRELVESLRAGAVSGFRKSKTDELESFLVENGYIDQAEPLTEQEIWSLTIGRINDDIEKSEVDIEDVLRLLERVRAAATRKVRTAV